MNDLQIKKLLREKAEGRYSVGGRLGLYFRVSKEGTGTWVVRYKPLGRKRREITIGCYTSEPGGISLKDARIKAA